MRLTTIAIDKVRYRPWRDAADEYLKRIKRYGVRVTELELKPPRGKRSDADQRRAEGELLAAALPDGALSVVLDERGRQLDSPSLAAWIGERRDLGQPLAFVVGGTNGHAEPIRKRASLLLSLSAMTLPHELARVVLYEQIYRAFTILAGEPYHR